MQLGWGRLQTEMRNCLAISLAAALALPALAQTRAALETELPASAPPTIRRLVPEVQMVFSAQDHRGHPLPNLGASQVLVLDNGVPAPLTSFQAADGLPLRAALLLDGSDSMRPGFTAQRQAALAFVRRLQRSGCDQIVSMEFG